MSKLLLISILASYVSADLEIAPYEVTKSHEGWEERSLPALKWISAEGFDIRPHDGDSHREIFYKLFNYIDGGKYLDVTKIPLMTFVKWCSLSTSSF